MTEHAMRRALYENLAAGDVEIVGENEAGEPLWRATDSGRERAEQIIDRFIDAHETVADAAAALAAELEIPIPIALETVVHRLRVRADEFEDD